LSVLCLFTLVSSARNILWVFSHALTYILLPCPVRELLKKARKAVLDIVALC